jgi:hypothetical protein
MERANASPRRARPRDENGRNRRDAAEGLESCVEGFAWAENNLGVQAPYELQGQGVNVFFAPMISPDEKVVNLANGRVERFVADEPRPQAGYYAEYASLERFCRENGLPLTETDGQVSILPIGHEEAGDPLTHVGE